jgi:hypothetical protein
MRLPHFNPEFIQRCAKEAERLPLDMIAAGKNPSCLEILALHVLHAVDVIPVNPVGSRGVLADSGHVREGDILPLSTTTG